MVLRVKLLGSDVPGDPYRVNLPTYQLLFGNVEHGYAYVIVPDDVHGLSADDLKSESVEHTTHGDHFPTLSNANLAKLHDHMDTTYREHRGKFRVEIA